MALVSGSSATITVIGRGGQAGGGDAEAAQADDPVQAGDHQGPLATLWELVAKGLDVVGLRCHRHRLTSRGYRLLRHCVYSGCMALAMLLAIVVDCYLWASDSGCGTALQLWSAITSAAILYATFFWLLEALYATMLRRFYGIEAPRGPTTLRCKAAHHVACTSVTLIGLGAILLMMLQLDLVESKVFVIIVAITNALLSSRCIKWTVKVLADLEQASRLAERRAFHDRRPTFAELLEVQFNSNAEQRAAHVTQMQQEVAFDSECVQEHSECCICSRSFDEVEEIRRTVCGHVFHATCLHRWFLKRETCPLCRKDLSGRQAPPRPHGQENDNEESRLEMSGNNQQFDLRPQVVGTTRQGTLVQEMPLYVNPDHRRFLNLQFNVHLQVHMQLPPGAAPSAASIERQRDAEPPVPHAWQLRRPQPVDEELGNSPHGEHLQPFDDMHRPVHMDESPGGHASPLRSPHTPAAPEVRTISTGSCSSLAESLPGSG